MIKMEGQKRRDIFYNNRVAWFGELNTPKKIDIFFRVIWTDAP